MGFWEDVALSKLINADDDEDVMEAGFLFGLEEEKEEDDPFIDEEDADDLEELDDLDELDEFDEFDRDEDF